MSGKTQRATELAAFFTDSSTDVIILNDEFLRISKQHGYTDPTAEKKSRAALLSAVERWLTKDRVVICDGLNYIKGFRYQLYCIARSIGTPSCTLYCAISPQTSKDRNSLLGVYDPVLFESLCSRLEEPDGRNRWDAPLFTVLPQDPPLTHSQQSTGCIALQIVEAVINRKAARPNLSTVVKPLAETNYLHDMDQVTNDIVEAFIQAQKDGRTGSVGLSPHSSCKLLVPSRHVSLAELRRLRRQFIQINRLHTLIALDRLATSFVEYLATNLSN